MSQSPEQLRARRRAEADRRQLLRRRRAALGGVAALAAIVGAVLGSQGAGEPSTPAADAPAVSCPAEVASSPRRLAGQMLIVRMEATATQSLLERVANGEIGGVIVFPPAGTDPSDLSAQIAKLRRAASRTGAPAPLVAIDQEGGAVKRLATLPPDHSPAAIARLGERTAAAEGSATATALGELGIDVDLAPVLDVAAGQGSFIASRSFGDDPEAVAALGVAFGRALQEQGVAATAKHFPGLGLATENTDQTSSPIAAGRGALKPGLVPFEAAVDAGFDLVMVSNATYTAYDDGPASQSPRLIEGLLRGRLGYEGAVITDDLGAGALTTAGIGEGAAAVGAAGAGADLLLFALSDATEASDALVAAIRGGGLDRNRLVASCARTTALRQRLAEAG